MSVRSATCPWRDTNPNSKAEKERCFPACSLAPIIAWIRWLRTEFPARFVIRSRRKSSERPKVLSAVLLLIQLAMQADAGNMVLLKTMTGRNGPWERPPVVVVALKAKRDG